MKQCPFCMASYSDEHVFCQTDGARLVEVHEWKPGTIVRDKYGIAPELGQGTARRPEVSREQSPPSWAQQVASTPPQPPAGAQNQAYIPPERVIGTPAQQQLGRQQGKAWKIWLLAGGVVLALIVGFVAWQFLKPKAPVIVTFEAKPDSIEAGQRSQLAWDVLHAGSVSLEPGLGQFPPGKGSVMVAPRQDFTYELVATGPKGTARSSVTVRVKQTASPPPTARAIYEDDLHSHHNFATSLGLSCPTAYVLGGLSIGSLRDNGCALKLYRGKALGALNSSVRIEVSVKLVAGDPSFGFGVGFGAPKTFQTSGQGFYAFEVTGNEHYQLCQWVGNRKVDHLLLGNSVWPSDPILRKGNFEINRIRVDIQGKTISYYVNGKFLGNYQAAAPVEGFAGLIVGGQGQFVVFSDLVITQLE